MLKGICLVALWLFPKHSLLCEMHFIATGPWTLRTRTLALFSCSSLLPLPNQHLVFRSGRSGPMTFLQPKALQSQLYQSQECVSPLKKFGLLCPLYTLSVSHRSLTCSPRGCWIGGVEGIQPGSFLCLLNASQQKR